MVEMATRLTTVENTMWQIRELNQTQNINKNPNHKIKLLIVFFFVDG